MNHSGAILPSSTRPARQRRTRRGLLTRLAAAAGAAFVAGFLFVAPQWAPTDALAQRKSDASTVDMGELMQSGTIPEKTLGPKDAPVTIVEYASLTCSHCANFHNNTWPKLREKYVDTGKVYFVFRDFPLDNYAAAAAMLARCTEDEKYFPFVKALFDQQEKWAYVQPGERIATLLNFSKQAGFTEETFEKCLTDQTLLDGINGVRQRANEEFGVRSTPTFFINGKRLQGGYDIEAFDEALGEFLSE